MSEWLPLQTTLSNSLYVRMHYHEVAYDIQACKYTFFHFCNAYTREFFSNVQKALSLFVQGLNKLLHKPQLYMERTSDASISLFFFMFLDPTCHCLGGHSFRVQCPDFALLSHSHIKQGKILCNLTVDPTTKITLCELKYDIRFKGRNININTHVYNSANG